MSKTLYRDLNQFLDLVLEKLVIFNEIVLDLENHRARSIGSFNSNYSGKIDCCGSS